MPINCGLKELMSEKYAIISSGKPDKNNDSLKIILNKFSLSKMNADNIARDDDAEQMRTTHNKQTFQSNGHQFLQCLFHF